jgi:uncharacterized protein
MESFETRMGLFPITSKSDVQLVMKNAGAKKAKVEGHVELEFKAICDRCLSEVSVPLVLDFEEMVTSPDTVHTEESEEDDFDIMEGYQLNVEAFVYNEILVNWPMKILCRPDCKGVCPVCGKNLNDGECGCDTFVPDPRMAVIQDIFNANKEV